MCFFIRKTSNPVGDFESNGDGCNFVAGVGKFITTRRRWRGRLELPYVAMKLSIYFCEVVYCCVGVHYAPKMPRCVALKLPSAAVTPAIVKLPTTIVQLHAVVLKLHTVGSFLSLH
jgi:hypothetical protein